MVESASGTLATSPEDQGVLVGPIPSKVAEASSKTEYRIVLLTPYD